MNTAIKDAILLAVAGMLLLTNEAWCWKCDVKQEVCDVWLEVAHGLTMMKEKSLVVLKGGHLYHHNTSKCTRGEMIPVEDVVTGDGWPEPKLVITVNGTVPGPTIEVHHNQTVRLHLRNKMLSESTSLHFHGQSQRGTPYMDGVAFVSQCPLLPGQTFVHQFKADPPGTYWYHSHSGGQQGMGMYGGFVVHPKEGADPSYEQQYELLFQDWNHDWDTTVGYLKMAYGMYVHGQKLPPAKGLSNVSYSAFRIQSALINGRGRHRPSYTAPHNGAPLSTFTVRPGKKYRFRLIHAGSVYPYRVSVDSHQLRVVATDGMELKEPIVAESIILTPGERYDFELTANQTVANYWIRGTTLEIKDKHVAEAILRYEGASEYFDPMSKPTECSPAQPCVVVNCPFKHYADQDSYHCISVAQLRSVEKMPDHMGRNAPKIKEYFLNFAFPGTTFTPAAVNGIQAQLPHVSALTQPLEFHTRCPGEGYICDEDRLCSCTAVLDLEEGEVAQLVFLNLGIGQGWDHPIHMHGHSFRVLKLAYPHYDSDTGNFLTDNKDVDCRGNPDRRLSYCNNATWTNSSWSGNEVPGLELDYPILKDTINVPTGGYVVVRIQADNPGVWPLHCHVSLHLEDGMLLLLNESYPQHPVPPKGFPQCRDFIV